MKTVASFLLFASLTVIPTLALADTVPPDNFACQSLTAGASCKTSTNDIGTCQASKCTRLVYSDAGSDAADSGTGPKSEEYDCLKCVATASSSSSSSGSSGASSSGSADGGPLPLLPGSAGGGGCAMSSPGSAAASFGLALAFGLLVNRRKRQA